MLFEDNFKGSKRTPSMGVMVVQKDGVKGMFFILEKMGVFTFFKCVSIVLCITALQAQTQNLKSKTNPKSLTSPPSSFEKSKPSSQNYSSSVGKAQNQAGKDKDTKSNGLDGLAGANWGDAFGKVHTYLKNLAAADFDEKKVEKIEIINIIQNQYILIKRNDIIYSYNFYKTPFTVARLDAPNLVEDEYNKNVEGKLFHVQLRLPSMETELIQQKISDKYGKVQVSYIDDKGQGYIVWKLNKGFIYLWCESYSGKSFSRRMDYISNQFSEQIAKEYKDYFIAKEKYVIQKAKVN